jgi:hypothetical protein
MRRIHCANPLRIRRKTHREIHCALHAQKDGFLYASYAPCAGGKVSSAVHHRPGGDGLPGLPAQPCSCQKKLTAPSLFGAASCAACFVCAFSARIRYPIRSSRRPRALAPLTFLNGRPYHVQHMSEPQADSEAGTILEIEVKNSVRGGPRVTRRSPPGCPRERPAQEPYHQRFGIAARC